MKTAVVCVQMYISACESSCLCPTASWLWRASIWASLQLQSKCCVAPRRTSVLDGSDEGLLEIQAWWRHSSLHPTFITIITAAPTAWLLALPAIFTSSFFCICIIPCYIRWFIDCLGYLDLSAPFYIDTLISRSFNFSNSVSLSSSTQL